VRGRLENVLADPLRRAREEGCRAGLELRSLHIVEDDNYDAEDVNFELSSDYEKIAERLAAVSSKSSVGPRGRGAPRWSISSARR
jgi:hypothetical protein